MRRITSLIAASIVATLGAACICLVSSSPAVAADARLFDPGYLISDELFFNSGLASESDVNSLIQAQGASCTSTAGNPGCLKHYRMDTPTRAADAYCGQYSGAANETAAAVITRVGGACGINPQVLAVLIQKESSLLTRNNPSASAYRIATGYGCPDTAACDTRYYGFFNQVYSAARQFKIYAAIPQSFNYRAGRDNSIAWNPSAACGRSTVFIRNTATAALYNYTPYRPNQAALNNLYGTGDACSSYGNRNFWRIFTDWFGSPTISRQAIAFTRALYQDLLSRQPGEVEAAGWGRALANGMPSNQVAGGFVNSDEFRLIKIDEAYRTVLGREPELQGRLGWLNGMRAGVLAPDDVTRSFYTTDEFFLGAGRGTNDGFVTALYDRLLLRAAGPGEVAEWSAIAASSGRGEVVNRIWNSPETARGRVTSMYRLYLDRVPDEQGLVEWGNYSIIRGDSATRSAILGSLEYWVRSSIRYP